MCVHWSFVPPLYRLQLSDLHLYIILCLSICVQAGFERTLRQLAPRSTVKLPGSLRQSHSATTPHAHVAAANEHGSSASLAVTASSSADEWKMIALYQTREAERRERAERVTRHAQQDALTRTLDEQVAEQRRLAHASITAAAQAHEQVLAACSAFDAREAERVAAQRAKAAAVAAALAEQKRQIAVAKRAEAAAAAADHQRRVEFAARQTEVDAQRAAQRAAAARAEVVATELENRRARELAVEKAKEAAREDQRLIVAWNAKMDAQDRARRQAAAEIEKKMVFSTVAGFQAAASMEERARADEERAR